MATFYKNDANNFLAALQVATPAPAGSQGPDAKTSDGAVAKHVHVVEIEQVCRLLKVTVGSTEHPMETAHYIQWIALEADDRLEVHYLKPGQSPVAFFPGGVKAGTVYAYCNLHGLWKAEF